MFLKVCIMIPESDISFRFLGAAVTKPLLCCLFRLILLYLAIVKKYEPPFAAADRIRYASCESAACKSGEQRDPGRLRSRGFSGIFTAVLPMRFFRR